MTNQTAKKVMEMVTKRVKRAAYRYGLDHPLQVHTDSQGRILATFTGPGGLYNIFLGINPQEAIISCHWKIELYKRELIELIGEVKS